MWWDAMKGIAAEVKSGPGKVGIVKELGSTPMVEKSGIAAELFTDRPTRAGYLLRGAEIIGQTR